MRPVPTLTTILRNPGDRPLPWCVAEIGQTWGGNLETGVRLVQQCADAGAWGVKFQFLQPERIASNRAMPYWQTTRHANTQAEAFELAGAPDYHDPRWAELFAAAREANAVPFATPFDVDAVEALADLGVDLYKVASGDITNVELLEAVRSTGKPVVLSTGAADDDDVNMALSLLHPVPVVLLACTLSYPTADVAARFGKIAHLEGYELGNYPDGFVGSVATGYSDHTLGIWAADPAVHSGALMLEKHVTVEPADRGLDRFCADDDMALTPTQLRHYVERARTAMVQRGEVALTLDESERAAHVGARRSLFATRDLPAGHKLVSADVTSLRPQVLGAIGAEHYRDAIGRELREGLAAGDVLTPDHLR